MNRSFSFPTDLQLELEYWSDTGDYDADELHEVCHHYTSVIQSIKTGEALLIALITFIRNNTFSVNNVPYSKYTLFQGTHRA